MRQLVHLRRALFLGLLACVVVLPAASAATTDRVQVGRPGQNATAGFPLTLFTSVALLPDYRALGRFDGESRNWGGPDYRAGSLGGKATLDWQVTFAPAGSAAVMARNALGGQSWPVAERPKVHVPHLVGGRKVGSIPAAAFLTKAPGENNAQFESALAFSLCRGVFAATKFSLASPGSEYAASPADTFLVRACRPCSGITIARSTRWAKSPSRATCLSAA